MLLILLALVLLVPSAPALGTSHLLFVLAGGYSSCGNQLVRGYHDQLHRDALESQKELGIETSVIFSCFTGGIRTDEAEKLYASRIDGEGHEEPQRQMSVDEFPDYVRQAIRGRDTKLVLVGHSHGGWLVLKTAIALGRRFPIRRLVTIDAISVVKVTANLYKEEMLAALRTPRLLDEGQHTQAPTDLRDEFPLIRSLVHRAGGLWTNYYEEQFAPLHSRAIAEADRNVRCAYPDGESIAAMAHYQISVDPKIWGEIRADLARALAHFDLK